MLREWVGGQEYAYAEIYVHTRSKKCAWVKRMATNRKSHTIGS